MAPEYASGDRLAVYPHRSLGPDRFKNSRIQKRENQLQHMDIANTFRNPTHQDVVIDTIERQHLLMPTTTTGPLQMLNGWKGPIRRSL